MTTHDSDDDLLRELQDVRRPPTPPLAEMWAQIAPQASALAKRPRRVWLWPAGLAAATAALIWVATVPPTTHAPTVTEASLAGAAAALEREAARRMGVLPASTAAAARANLAAIADAINDLRALVAASPDAVADDESRLMLERLERQRLESLRNTLDDVATAEQLGLAQNRKVL